MRKMFCYIILLLNIILLNGCSPATDGNSLIEKEMDSSYLVSVKSVFSFAQIGGKIAYFPYGNASIHIMDNQGEQEKVAERPSDRETLEVTAGKEYFYVYCSADEVCDEEQRDHGYLRIYDMNANLLKEVFLPFTRVNVIDGLLYGYYDGNDRFSSWLGDNANSRIEATHYIAEDKFLDSFPSKIADWNRISGGEEVTIANHQLYRCPVDYFHKTEYYSDRKPIPVFEQVDYILYCNGRLSSEEYDNETKPRMGQIYGMMHKEEKDFLIYSFQDGDKIYGICNVYHSTEGFLVAFTKDIDYSFSFRYDEKEDKLYKVKEYDDTELVYENDKICLYHKTDGVYCRDIKTGMIEKVFDFDGKVKVTILDNYAWFQGESEASEEKQSKQVFKKLW